MHWLPQHSIHFFHFRYALATPAHLPLSGMHRQPQHSFLSQVCIDYPGTPSTPCTLSMHWRSGYSFHPLHAQIGNGYGTPALLPLPALSGMNWLSMHSLHSLHLGMLRLPEHSFQSFHSQVPYALATPALLPLSGMHRLSRHSFDSLHSQVCNVYPSTPSTPSAFTYAMATQHSFHSLQSQVCTGYPGIPSTPCILSYAMATPALLLLPSLSGTNWLPRHFFHSLHPALCTTMHRAPSYPSTWVCTHQLPKNTPSNLR
jgi:hypothetical protein